MLGLDMTSRLIKSGVSDLPSSPIRAKVESCSLLPGNRSYHYRLLPIGGLVWRGVPQNRGVVSVFYSFNRGDGYKVSK